MMGNFSETRCVDDRFPATACDSGVIIFNEFIRDAQLIEYNVGGIRFTRISEDGTTLSKIDRFFACVNFFNPWLTASVTMLPREYSNHCPLVFLSSSTDYGPSPFRFYNYWLLDDSITPLVRNAWEFACVWARADSKLAAKLRVVKFALKAWKSMTHNCEENEIWVLKEKICHTPEPKSTTETSGC